MTHEDLLLWDKLGFGGQIRVTFSSGSEFYAREHMMAVRALTEMGG